MRQSAVVRFWDQVDRDGPVYEDLGPCWVWTGAVLKAGYGKHGVQGLVHRYSWLLHNGEIPDGLHVLHKCDNPPCVNPDHLFVGTVNDNMQDKIAKGRQVRGETQGTSKLTEEQVREIKARYRRYSHQHGSGALAREYGVGAVQIWRIAMGHEWRHVQ